MDSRTERRILQKAQYVRDAVEVLAEKRDSLTLAAYRSSRSNRTIVEREFETAIQACIDIAKMVLRTDGADVPPTNAAAFRLLGDRAILDDDTATGMAQAAGFRNVLAHQYGDEIDDEDCTTSCNPSFRCSSSI
ncbi:Uncharacterized conserved protein YutE, UPF0331/DUF86 family [Natronoarchaeum philippinense]|uniref:Uncharacterized conserved protein YutE, UPF0331/DUF86 family n=1 Tax=Natronoarchaeum philippinense TaxID=558529 RepID=A0A285NRX8_NATPI|nr:DUF86 domain-containing protein [Natronoarchaeum philippinense]SNZ11683.1 Uncharacterized conserved protein YutE, UPF0331/DUF86 family [Natronoarchaeum philippinense]